ncbi:MAG: hypothetical protein HC895_10120 [Leptolyngbyaceae cyanobacterium SM1_3_5]|nr:hypothetical protein [Leptolyngbyaceae cyanobacterium SM1_3_5]
MGGKPKNLAAPKQKSNAIGAAGSKISLARHNWAFQFDGSAAGCCSNNASRDG